MAGTDGKPRRPRLAPPASFDLEKRWPRCAFPQVTDPGILAALRAAQEMAVAAREGRASRGWSQQTLADAADVNRDLVVTLENGTAWLQLSSVSRILAPFGASVRVQKPKLAQAEDPQPRPQAQPRPEPGSQDWLDENY